MLNAYINVLFYQTNSRYNNAQEHDLQPVYRTHCHIKTDVQLNIHSIQFNRFIPDSTVSYAYK